MSLIRFGRPQPVHSAQSSPHRSSPRGARGARRGLAAALTSLALAASIGSFSGSAGAQTLPVLPAEPANPFATPTRAAFQIAQPRLMTYVLQHGGARVFGPAISRDFQLLGTRVQLFERGAVQLAADGTVRGLDLVDTLPLLRADGATFPSPDPTIQADLPSLDSPEYTDQALAAVDAGLLDQTAPDQWNDLAVNFGATFRATAQCRDLGLSGGCDDRLLLRSALDVWGLPTSAPTADPINPDLIYLRFQRGIMVNSQTSGLTQAVPVGDLFRRVLVGTGLPGDLRTDVTGSRFYAQYQPSAPLGLARSSELPATSLAGAFGDASTTLVSAQVAETPTPMFAPALPTFGTPAPTSTPGTPVPTPTPTLTSASTVAVNTAPQGPDPCAGDEQILFAPGKPYAGTDVLIAVTSARHHDSRTVRLTGPVKPGAVNERPGLNGWVWEWTISPASEGWYEFTFYTDGARACATSGFNVLPGFGATATPTPLGTATAFATITNIPTGTPTATSTLIPAPALATTTPFDPASGACAGQLLRVRGSNFGRTQADLNGNVLFVATSGQHLATVLSWTDSTILLSVNSGIPGGAYQVVVTTTAGASTPTVYQVGAC